MNMKLPVVAIREAVLAAISKGRWQFGDESLVAMSIDAAIRHALSCSSPSLMGLTEERLREEWTKGFELAHELQKCGHSRGDCRDPNYIPGTSTECDSKCIGCERENRLIKQLSKMRRAGNRMWTILCNENKGHEARNAWKEAQNP